VTVRQIIGCLTAGQELPQDFAEALMKDSTSTSIMVAKGGDLFNVRLDKPLKAQELLAIIGDDEFKDANGATLPIGFCITKGGKLSPESLQPFAIKRHDDTVLTTVMIGGQLALQIPEKSPHTQSYHAWQKISKKLERLYSSASDLAAFRASIMGEEFKDDMDMILGTEGAMTLLHADGSFDHCGVAQKGESFPWGIVSDALGHKPKAEEKPKKQSLLAKVLGTAPPAEPEKKVEEEKRIEPPAQPEVPPPIKEPEIPKNDVVPPGMMAFEMYTPRKGLKKQRELNRVLNDKLGCTPLGAWDHYEKGGQFPVPVAGSIKFGRTDHYEVFREECYKNAKTGLVSLDIVTKLPPPPVKEPEPIKEQAVNGVVSAQGKRHFNDVFMKRDGVMLAVAESRQDVLHPKFVTAKLVDKRDTTLASEGGMKQGVLDTLGWSERDIQAFLKDEDPKLVFLWARDQQLELISALKQLKEAKSQDTGKPVAKAGGMLANFAKAG
jgi:hypothetical protein